MGRAAKMSIDQYQGEVQPGAQKQDMAKGGPQQTPRGATELEGFW